MPCMTNGVHQDSAVYMPANTSDPLTSSFPIPVVSALWVVSDILFWGPLDQMNWKGLSVRESVQTPKMQAANIICGGGSDHVWLLT